ncbi:MAG: glycosyl transferase [Lachnospiraceae bacterium]|nr:glycosyl transferase [Lachnospiraceae bacterium]
MSETMIFCTLFDSGYLDKGLVLYDSLCKNAGDFRLYVVAFDETCRRVLSHYANERLVVISLAEFESEELLEAKGNRNAREYCWTCSCHAIKHVLTHYKESHCTYIDADMYFYQDPRCLLKEIEDDHCDVGIIRHGFIPNKENMRYINLSGEYCVEFNTFYRTDNGQAVLNWWCDQCLDCCTEKTDGIHFGDQKYVEQFQKRFTGVHVQQNKGAGVAPWNIARFELESAAQGDAIVLREKKTRETFPLIFYHFQQIRYLSASSADINAYLYPRRASLKLRDTIYLPYMRRLSDKRRELSEKHGIDLDQKTAYVKKQGLMAYIKFLIQNERDFLIAIRRLYRALFRRRHDYISW